MRDEPETGFRLSFNRSLITDHPLLPCELADGGFEQGLNDVPVGIGKVKGITPIAMLLRQLLDLPA